MQKIINTYQCIRIDPYIALCVEMVKKTVNLIIYIFLFFHIIYLNSLFQLTTQYSSLLLLEINYSVL